MDGGLARIGFRRDVKLFLAALVGYLIVVILALLLILQNSVITTVQTAEASWSATGEFVARDLGSLTDLDREQIQSRLAFYRGTFPLLAVALDRGDGIVIRSGFWDSETGYQVEIPTRNGRLLMIFDDSLVRHERWKFNVIAAIVIASTLGTTLLLVLYLPKIVRPIEEMLDHARDVEEKAGDVDEARYLVQTFKRSLDTLRDQKEELARLHAVEKSRADDLERVTSTLTRSITSGFIAVDAAGAIVEMNRVARDVLGIEPAPGARLDHALPDGPFAGDLLRCLTEQSSLTRHETTHPRPDGDVAIGLTTVPLRDETGGFLGFIAIFTDLTPIRSLEDRVRELQTLADLGEISAGIAHEFRNSLSTVLGYLRLAQRNPAAEESKDKIEAAEREARMLADAVSKLLAFSRRIELELGEVDLGELARDIAGRLGTDAGSSFAIPVHGETVRVRGDASLLRVVVENLVRNAIEAASSSEGEKRVEIEVGRAGERGMLRVSDNGPGIAEEEIPRVFLPFQSGRPGGFGLGLALARKIILLHEGDIRLERATRGMVATIELPLPG